MLPRPRDVPSFSFGVFMLALGGFGVAFGSDTVFGWIFLGGGAFRTIASFFFTWSFGEDERATGPGSLAATPAKRFRATGWPPSKDVDDYR